MRNLYLPLLWLLLLASCSGGSSGDEGAGTDACDLLSSRAKIIDGTTCKNITTPVFRIGVYGYYCTGTLISPSQILTAAHCVYNIQSKEAVSMGPYPPESIAIYSPETILPVALVSRVHAHPDFASDFIRLYNLFERSESISDFVAAVLSNGLADIAVLDLDRSLMAIPQPILVSSSPNPGDIFGIFGYGATDGDNPFVTTDLNSGRMIVEAIGRDNITAVFRDGGSNACYGDSGGPALKSIGVPDIIGTTSIGSSTNCARGEVSLFTLLSSPRLGNFIRAVAPSAEFE